MPRIEIQITGQVQGVFFRQTAGQIAEKLKLTGWVKNEPDGSVKIVAEGQKDNLRELAEWCRKGTEWARVENMEFEWKETMGEFKNFSVR